MKNATLIVILLMLTGFSHAQKSKKGKAVVVEIETTENGETKKTKRTYDISEFDDIEELIEEIGVMAEMKINETAGKVEININKAVQEVEEAIGNISIDIDIDDDKRSGSRAQLGVYTKATNNNEGVLITEVVDGSAAEKMGLQAGDILLEINGENIKSHQGLSNEIKRYEPGAEVEVRFKRDGKKQIEKVKLGKAESRSYSYSYNWNGSSHDDHGKEFKPNHQKLGVVLNVNNQTVKVNSVVPGSNAERMGLEEGDQILSFNGESVYNDNDLIDLIRATEPNDNVEIGIKRDGETQVLDGRMRPSSNDRLRPNPRPNQPAMSRFQKTRILIMTVDKDEAEEMAKKNNISTSELELESFELFPNPTSQEVKVGLNLPSTGKTKMTVYDLNGAIIYEKQYGKLDNGRIDTKVSLVGQPRGTYFLIVEQGGKSFKRKIVKS